MLGAIDPEFDELVAEWRAIVEREAPSIEAWEAAVAALAADERALRARGAWVHGRDDFFGVVGVARAEVRHSAILAWLMDPCARHGVGARFLEGVLQRSFAGESFDDLTDARVTCEVTRGECRADIVVTLASATIIIENKVDAEESDRQCDVLFERFREDRGARFLFLTPTGRAPETATGAAASAFARLGYRDVREILGHALRAAGSGGASARGRHIAEDYLITLGREF